jgi:hypothetical protein
MEEWRKGKHETADAVRSRLSWYFTERVMVMPYGRFGSVFKSVSFLQEDCLTLEDGTDRLLRNFGKKIPLYAAYISHEPRSHLHLRGRRLKSPQQKE